MTYSRRRFLKALGAGTLLGSLSCRGPQPDPPNVLLLTADDMNWNSVGAFGSPVENITPKIDQLAAGGMRSQHAHVNVAICAPSRTSMLSGREAHRHGVMADGPLDRAVPTLGRQLQKAGYRTGVHGKWNHLDPQDRFGWDEVVPTGDLGHGRYPSRYHKKAQAFFEAAKAQNQPFFLNANLGDPHRPLAGRDNAGPNDQPAPVRRTFSPEEVPVPGFLPDLPRVQEDIAAYYTSVYRADECVGAVLTALAETGLQQNTLVIFLSDHGMPFPFAKHECYYNSTKTPLVMRWPGHIEPGTVENRHMVMAADLMPTALEAAGLPVPSELDGRSLLPLLRGKSMEGRDAVYCSYYFHKTSHPYPVRSVQNHRFRYIVTFWSLADKSLRPFISKPMTYRAMEEAAEDDEAIAERLEFYLQRVPEELYDIQKDPDCVNNLIDDSGYQEEAKQMRRMLRRHMERTDDPALETFETRTTTSATRYLKKREAAGQSIEAKTGGE